MNMPAPGERLPEQRVGPFDAAAVAAYARASGDDNPIHTEPTATASDCPASGKRRGPSARRPCWRNSCWPVGETHPVVPTRPVGAIERLPVHRYLAEPHTHAQRRIDRSSRQGRIPQGSRGTLPFFERPPHAGGRKQWLHLHQGREPLDLDGLLATSSTKVAHRVSPIKRLHHRTHGIRF